MDGLLSYRIWIARAMLALVLFIAGLGGGVAAAAPPASKVDLCHRTASGTFQPISVSSNALAAHLAHGDVQQPNGLVPDSAGYVFDSNCGVRSWAYAVNVAPDVAAQDPAHPGTMFVGSGIPAVNFGTARDEAAGVELGMMVLYRQGPTVASTDDYGDGILHFSVNDGAQSTSNGSSSNNGNRAAWNFTFSAATGLNGATTDLNDFTLQLLYDVDPGPGTSYRTLTLEPGSAGAGLSGFRWRDQGTGLVFIADDEGNANVTQNSENYSFGFFQAFLTSPYGIGNAFAGPAQFDIVLQAFDGPQMIVRNHIAVDVLP